MTAARGHFSLAIPILATLFIHGALAGSLEVADRMGWLEDDEDQTITVEFEVKKAPPPQEEAKPKEPEPPPPLPPPEPEPQAVKPPPDRVARKDPQRVQEPPPDRPPPTQPERPPEEPAPGPPSPEGPPAEYTYKMPPGGGGGTMAVPSGAGPTGSAQGRRGGTGTGTGGGGPPDSQGTGGQRVASVASIKKMPEAVGDDYDYVRTRDYPEEARRLGIEGQIKVRILVNADGTVSEAKILPPGLGHGLDQMALKLAKKLRFKPARDANDQAVAVRITWTFNFKLPD